MCIRDSTYDHITQHINNLADTTQQNTLYTIEEDASLFTSDTTTPCEYNITKPIQTSHTISDRESKSKHPQQSIPKANIDIEMYSVIPIYNIMTLIMMMHSVSKISIWLYYSKNYKTLTGVYMIL